MDLKSAWTRVREFGGKLLTFLGLIALWIGALFSFGAAYYAKKTADSIASMEFTRIDYERNKYTSELMYRLGDFIERNGPLLPCVDALLKLDDADFRGLLDHPATFKFNAQNPTHGDVMNCLRPEERRALQKNEREWTNEQSYAVRHRIVSEVNQLDSLLISFNYGLGNRYMICQSLAGLTTQQAAPSRFAALLSRLREKNLMPAVTELWQFMKEFEKRQGCGSYKPDAVVTTASLKGSTSRTERLLNWLWSWIP
jgi:hypothetical protein